MRASGGSPGSIPTAPRRWTHPSTIRRPKSPRQPALDTSFGLTDRELEVLRLLAHGLSNRRIGDTLFITESTAGVHVSNILGKLGVASRVEAAALAVRVGLSD